MHWSFLKSSLGGACPSFMREWTQLRRTYPLHAPSSATNFLRSFRTHRFELLGERRIAEASRPLLMMKRVLGEADPILLDLLEGEVLVPLARQWKRAGRLFRRPALACRAAASS